MFAIAALLLGLCLFDRDVQASTTEHRPDNLSRVLEPKEPEPICQSFHTFYFRSVKRLLFGLSMEIDRVGRSCYISSNLENEQQAGCFPLAVPTDSLWLLVESVTPAQYPTPSVID